MGSFDWAASPLGPMETWPADLRAAVTRRLGQSADADDLATRLAEAEERYHALFNATDQGFCLIEVIFDAVGRAVDYKFLEVNPAFERHTGIPDAAGRSIREIAPTHDEHWFETYGRVALTGEPVSFENYSTPLARWWAATAFRIGDPAQHRIAVVFSDVTERKFAEQALRESAEDYRYAAELNPQVAWSAPPSGQLDRVAPRWEEWTGTTGLGASYADALHPDDVQRTFDAWGRSLTTGEPYDIVHRVRRLDGEHRWIRSRAYPRRDETGAIVRWYGTTEDIHQQKAAEDHLRLLVLELNHRVKNNLATVQSLAVQTLRASPTTAEGLEALQWRIGALAAAHDILTREHWEGADIGEVARGVLGALDSAGKDRIGLDGPHIRLRPNVALSLSMAFHELGTNAIKYGALGAEAGRVELAWSVDAAGDLTIQWRETGGPPVSPPAQRGFGSRLLERAVAGELGGEVTLDFAPAGLRCTIRAPLAKIAAG